MSPPTVQLFATLPGAPHHPTNIRLPGGIANATRRISIALAALEKLPALLNEISAYLDGYEDFDSTAMSRIHDEINVILGQSDTNIPDAGGRKRGYTPIFRGGQGLSRSRHEGNR